MDLQTVLPDITKRTIRRDLDELLGADKIVRLIMESDEIHFVIGTRINIAHQDPSLPVDLEIRRTVVKRIARLLEEKWLKKVSFEYI